MKHFGRLALIKGGLLSTRSGEEQGDGRRLVVSGLESNHYEILDSSISVLLKSVWAYLPYTMISIEYLYNRL